MSARKCSIRLLAMIASVSPGATPSSTSPAAASIASSRTCAHVTVRHDSPSGTSCLSEYAGSSAYVVAVSASTSISVRPAMRAAMSARRVRTSVKAVS